MASPEATPHRWRFLRAGGFDQVKLETGADFLHLDELDQKLWVALACPVAGLEFDPKTAALIDTDSDGRIRAAELLAAVKWACAMLNNPDDLIGGGDALALSAINPGSPEGTQLLNAASLIVRGTNQAIVTLAQVAETGEKFAAAPLNGDGIIVVESASDDASRRAITEITACVGSVNDISGKPGIDQTRADLFFAECAAFEAWARAADNIPSILILGEATASAVAALQAIHPKVDDFFARCRLAAFDERAAAVLNRKEEDYALLAALDLSLSVIEAAAFPLARVAAGASLPLQGPINPAYATQIEGLREAVIKPLLGERTELAESDWRMILAKLVPFMAWQAGKAGASVEPLGLERVRELLAGPERAAVNTLIAQDSSLEGRTAAFANLEKLIRFTRDLRLLCENFVNFKNLYLGPAPAIFQAGVLYLDQRSCQLCLVVDDPAKHSVMAGLAGAFLAYLDCTRKGGTEKLSVVALFSQGDDENLMVGRNGVFYDRKGRDYDATITKILTNPISLRQAFWLPYKKLVRFIEEQVVRRASAASAQVDSQLAAVGSALPQPATAPRKPAVDLSIVALVSVACGSLAGAFVTGMGLLSALPAWKLPFIALGVLAIISGPSLALAYIKLHKRNLGPILDANGWAINTRAKINVPFGARLTGVARLPPGATVDLQDRYAPSVPAWPKLLLAIFVVWWIYAILASHGLLNYFSH